MNGVLERLIPDTSASQFTSTGQLSTFVKESPLTARETVKRCHSGVKVSKQQKNIDITHKVLRNIRCADSTNKLLQFDNRLVRYAIQNALSLSLLHSQVNQNVEAIQKIEPDLKSLTEFKFGLLSSCIQTMFVSLESFYPLNKENTERYCNKMSWERKEENLFIVKLKDIRFSQPRVINDNSAKYSIFDNANELQQGSLHPDNIPPMECALFLCLGLDGLPIKGAEPLLFSFDNRRLAKFVLGCHGETYIPITLTDPSYENHSRNTLVKMDPLGFGDQCGKIVLVTQKGLNGGYTWVGNESVDITARHTGVDSTVYTILNEIINQIRKETSNLQSAPAEN